MSNGAQGRSTCATISTALGHYGASGLPEPLALALLFLNACFLLILLVDVRECRALIAIVSGVAIGIPVNAALPDIGLIVTGITGGTIGFLAGEWHDRRQRSKEHT